MSLLTSLATKLHLQSDNPQKINKIKFNSNDCETTLCKLGGKYNTDKSPLNDHKKGGIKFRHAYTPIYDLLFAPLRFKEINLAEIGIFKGGGIKMFRDYFNKAHIYGFDFDQEYLDINKSFNLEQTQIAFVDIKSEDSITNTFKKTQVLFDIIIDDSTHIVHDQVRIIKCCTPFLKSGGILVIEDIFNDYRSPEHFFEDILNNLSIEFCFTSFIYPKNRKTRVGKWNNEKLLVLIKN